MPLLALFGGAAFWLVVGSVLGLMASIKFHAPDFLANCAWLTYGRLQPAADDALLYGFCLPAGLGVALWLLARLSQTPLRGAVVPIVAANLWHLGVFVGLVAILIGDSTGFAWLEFPRGGSVPIFFAYLLLALWAMMIFAGRRERALYPSQWFLVAALFWFPWIYSTANLFLVAWPVRGVAQAVIGWWFANNLLVVWTGLVGSGRGVLFPAEIHRSSVAKPLPRVVRVLDVHPLRHLVRHPAGRAGARLDADAQCRRCRAGCLCRCSPSAIVMANGAGFDKIQLGQRTILLHRFRHWTASVCPD